MKEAIPCIESDFSFLCEGLKALGLLVEEIELEGYQEPDRVDGIKAICFVRSFPAYLAAFNVILREMNANADRIRSTIESAG